MKIAYIGQKGIPASYGGVERHVEELGKRLTKNPENEVYIYCRKWYVEKSQKLKIKNQNDKIVALFIQIRFFCNMFQQGKTIHSTIGRGRMLNCRSIHSKFQMIMQTILNNTFRRLFSKRIKVKSFPTAHHKTHKVSFF